MNRFKKILLSSLASGMLISMCSAMEIHEHGYWYGDGAAKEHRFDGRLAGALVTFFKSEGAKSIVDFGCGMADYVKVLQENQFECEGYDGHPDTPKLTQGRAKVQDLSKRFDLNKRFDWVLSLEVGEHIPFKYERIFIENLVRHNTKGIVLSWAERGQGGNGHFNERENWYIKKVLAKYGYTNDLTAENGLRAQTSLGWFKRTIMVFRKAETASSVTGSHS